jgi:outer membrane protein
MKIKLLTYIFICGNLFALPLQSQQSEILTSYVNEGLKSNLTLKQKEASYEKSLYVLREAKSYFYPQVSLNARYTVADGGRLIEFPIGDLLNPVYSSLNALTGTSNFPSVDNQSFRFLRPHEQETKIQVIQPLLNTDIHFNNKIKSGLAQAELADVETYKRQLVSEIKVSYFNVLKTIQLLDLLQEVKILAEENQRVNERLLANNMVTRDRLYRSEAELSKIDQQISSAEKDYHLAKSYFNFLLNRDLDSEILIEDELIPDFSMIGGLPDLSVNALKNREELMRLTIMEDISSVAVNMNRMKALPEFLFAMDYGFQGTKYRFTGDDDFVMASVVLRWNIFHGFQNQHKISQSRVDNLIIQTKKEEVTEKIKLEVKQSWYELQAAQKAVIWAEKQYYSAKESFKIVDKHYNNSMTGFLEYLDARTELTIAGTNQINSYFEYLSKLAGFERVSCMYPIDNE